jgi:hypothetical protein
MPNELVIATTTDSGDVVKAAAANDESAARVPAPKFDPADASYEHPRSERALLLERLAEAENDLAQFATEQVTTNEPAGEEKGAGEQPDDEILQRVREAAVQDAVQHAREQYAREQQQAHLAPVQTELNELRAAALVPFRARMAELTAGLNLKVPNIPIPDAVSDVLVTLSGGPEATLYLAQHPEEARQLQTLPESIAVAKVAALTARLDPAARQRRPSQAPAPIRPISGSATRFQKPPDEMTYQEYRTFRDKQEKTKYRR